MIVCFFISLVVNLNVGKNIKKQKITEVWFNLVSRTYYLSVPNLNVLGILQLEYSELAEISNVDETQIDEKPVASAYTIGGKDSDCPLKYALVHGSCRSTLLYKLWTWTLHGCAE